MNAKIFRLVFSQRLQMPVPVGEQRSACGKSTARGAAPAGSTAHPRLKLLALGLAAIFAGPSLGLPASPTVTNGGATFDQSGSTLTVTNTPNAIINWGSFSIGQNEITKFVQQSASSAVLNRVVGQDPSQILGALQSNGRVFLINPNGIVFGQGSTIDTAGLVASTLNLSDADFLAGKQRYVGNGSEGQVDNQGTITTAAGGFVYLIAPNVENSGIIRSPNGEVLLAAGHSVEVADGLNPALRVLLTAPAGQVVNIGQIFAESGQIGLYAGVVANTGTISASSAVAEGGKIYLKASRAAMLEPGGSISANGTSGGSIGIESDFLSQENHQLSADGSTGAGGNISITTQTALIQNAGSVVSASSTGGNGGNITLDGGQRLYSSARMAASGSAGGKIDLLGKDVILLAAQVDATGTQGQGGTIHVGGGLSGQNIGGQNNAQTTFLNSTTQLDVSGGRNGNGGTAVVWADGQTQFYGSILAEGGSDSGNGGFIEVSGRDSLAFGGSVFTSAPHGANGTLLLDPTNLVIDSAAASGTTYATLPLLDPDPTLGNFFGENVLLLSNGNIVVTAHGDDFGGQTDAGAAYLFNGSNGAIISTLRGNADDQVGSDGILALSNGNYVVQSSLWGIGKGAATWASGTSGVSGTVSSSNSLVGSAFGERVGESGRITALTNGNYVVGAPFWSGNKGAATWADGNTGTSGLISAANSLVGSFSGTPGDYVGSSIIPLSNGNYVVRSPEWNGNRGAATWGNGTTGLVGVVGAGNSLVGDAPFQQVGSEIVPLTNGNYVVGSRLWGNLNGAATWGDGNTGVAGTISSSNSLIGSNQELVGSTIIALNNGNYVVGSPGNLGAATWGDGSTGITGVVSSANSLVGSSNGDQVGSNLFALSNGNYVVGSVGWDNGAITNAGAVTWGNGTTGLTGTVSSANSLVGSSTDELLGSKITALNNGHYVVASPFWDNGLATDAGAVIWANGNTGITGTTAALSGANSLIGTSSNSQVGTLVTALSNGNYVVGSENWNDGISNFMGAATWGNGNTGVTGTVSSSNSLIGTAAFERVGKRITALTNGNYVIGSELWGGGKGAASWGNGTSGISGTISSANSLVGATTSDRIGSNVFALNDGNYVLSSNNWGGNKGAVSWGNGSTGATGVFSAANSLTGTTSSSRLHWRENIGASGFLVEHTNALGNFELNIATASASLSGTINSGLLAFGDNSGSDSSLTPAQLTTLLNAGTNVVLQADNDIAINSAITVLAGGNGGDLSLQAGRSLLINADITTDNGNLTLSANDAAATLANRGTGSGDINIAAGVTVDTGSGAFAATIGNLSTPGAFTNAGNLSVGSASSVVAFFNNTGLFRLNGGTLNLFSGGSNSGTFNLAAGTEVNLTGGTFTLLGNSDVIGNGLLKIDGGSLLISAAGRHVDQLQLASGSLNTGGGSNGLTVDNQFLWDHGTISGGGNFTVAGNASFANNTPGANAMLLSNQAMTIAGDLAIAGQYWLDMNGGELTVNGATTVDTSAAPGFYGIIGASSLDTVRFLGGLSKTAGTEAYVLANLNLTQSGTVSNLAGGKLVFDLGNGSATLDNTSFVSAAGTLIQLADGDYNVIGNASFSGAGTTQIGNADSRTPVLTTAAGNTLTNNGTLVVTSNATLANAGTLINNGTLTSTPDLTLASGGTYRGSGTLIANLVNAGGTVGPGNSPGTMNITGNYTQGASGTLLMELGGTAQGVDYDWLKVSGTATLDGTLQVALFGGFAPAAGNVFNLISASGGISGTFATQSLPAYPLTPGYGAQVFGLAMPAATIVPIAPTTTLPPALTNTLALLDTTVNLAALSHQTPLLYSSGQSSPTASGSGALTQTAETMLPAWIPPPPENTAGETGLSASASAVMPLFTQLIAATSRQEPNHESRLTCR